LGLILKKIENTTCAYMKHEKEEVPAVVLYI